VAVNGMTLLRAAFPDCLGSVLERAGPRASRAGSPPRDRAPCPAPRRDRVRVDSRVCGGPRSLHPVAPGAPAAGTDA